jgi:hypothetical protein
MSARAACALCGGPVGDFPVCEACARDDGSELEPLTAQIPPAIPPPASGEDLIEALLLKRDLGLETGRRRLDAILAARLAEPVEVRLNTASDLLCIAALRHALGGGEAVIVARDADRKAHLESEMDCVLMDAGDEVRAVAGQLIAVQTATDFVEEHLDERNDRYSGPEGALVIVDDSGGPALRLDAVMPEATYAVARVGRPEKSRVSVLNWRGTPQYWREAAESARSAEAAAELARHDALADVPRALERVLSCRDGRAQMEVAVRDARRDIARRDGSARCTYVFRDSLQDRLDADGPAFAAAIRDSYMGAADEPPQPAPPARECSICMEAAATTVLVPCGHVCACEACAAKLSECPVCMRGVEQAVKLFYA